jgi:SAM-dependent methyltransferase
MSKLAGENGHVTGIDMTDKQIEVAIKYIDIQTKRFDFKVPNVTFIHDYMENISTHFKPNSLDIVTSNCVINLAQNKESVIKQIYDVLKDGGEFYFSDVYADRRVPDHIRKNPILYGECLGGAMYIKDFVRLARKTGFADPRIISMTPINIDNLQIKGLIENIVFYSITYRLWKIEGLEDACEDFGHIAIYKGGILESPHKFELDSGHIFERNRAEKVCGNTALMLSETRFNKFFEIIGNFDAHFGEFKDCGDSSKDTKGTASCC